MPLPYRVTHYIPSEYSSNNFRHNLYKHTYMNHPSNFHSHHRKCPARRDYHNYHCIAPRKLCLRKKRNQEKRSKFH